MNGSRNIIGSRAAAHVSGRDPDFLGAGWEYPVRSADVVLVEGEERIRQSIFLIVFTMPGERVMRPEFGCRIHELVFAAADTATATLAAVYVREALERWEPRVTNLDVRGGVNHPGELLVSVDYTVIATNTRRNLVFPFYLETPGGRV